MSIDYTITPLIEKIFAPEDLNTTGHTIFFHRKDHTVSMKKKKEKELFSFDILMQGYKENSFFCRYSIIKIGIVFQELQSH